MEKEELNFELRIQSVTRQDGGVSFHASELNSGVPYEFVITMVRAWLKGTESAYFEKFNKENFSQSL